ESLDTRNKVLSWPAMVDRPPSSSTPVYDQQDWRTDFENRMAGCANYSQRWGLSILAEGNSWTDQLAA
ncbi:MAG: hypothetical protein ACI8W8_002088, partial [Rhodothermales bacterium]